MVVVGAGPAGLAAAVALASRGVGVHVLEATDRVGGLCASLDLWGRRVDLGPHRFLADDARVLAFWREFRGDDLRAVERVTHILFEGSVYRYPLRVVDALLTMGPLRAGACVVSYLAGRLRRTGSPWPDFEAWGMQRFGRRLFDMFFRSYTEKLWGLPCRELDADFATDRIGDFSLGQAILAGVGLGRGQRTLAERFDHPAGGTGSVYERMASRVTALGSRIETGRAVAGIEVEGGCVRGVRLADGGRVEARAVVSTMPLTDLVAGLPGRDEDVDRALSFLSYRTTTLVYLRLEPAASLEDQWVYVHSPELGAGRVTNYDSFDGAARPDTVVSLEYWSGDEGVGADDDALVARAGAELRASGLCGPVRVVEGRVVPLHRSYPVYRLGYRKHVEVLRARAAGVGGLVTAGRNGTFRYDNQDGSILAGLSAADEVLARVGGRTGPVMVP